MATYMERPEQVCRNFIDGYLARAFNLPAEIRPIDRVKPRARSRPMKVLCLGFSRTGTFSLYNALIMTGFRPYHMAEALANASLDFPCWSQGLEAKFMKKGNTKPWGREEFDKLLGDFDAVLDVPCINFAEELIAAYPEAKVILTTRDVDAWLKSISTSVGPVLSWKSWDTLGWADPDLVTPFVKFHRILDQVVPFTHAAPGRDNSALRKTYLDHYENVEKICPPERLMIKPLGSGWEEMCPFLGIPVPDFPYPRMNDSAFFVDLHKTLIRRATWKACEQIGAYILPIAAVAGVWAFRNQLILSR